MKERPILFNAPMVRETIAETKTQTRRVVKCPRHYQIEEKDDGRPWPWMYNETTDGDHWLPCPFGVPGDQLWVRETWMADPPITSDWPSTQFHGCKPRDHSLIPDRFKVPGHCLYRADGHNNLQGWTPAIHMPRWASRITLEVTDVRVERLQDISEADALAEGVSLFGKGDAWSSGSYNVHADPIRLYHPIALYGQLWESINGPGSWDQNPWVWAITFKRLA